MTHILRIMYMANLVTDYFVLVYFCLIKGIAASLSIEIIRGFLFSWNSWYGVKSKDIGPR